MHFTLRYTTADPRPRHRSLFCNKNVLKQRRGLKRATSSPAFGNNRKNHKPQRATPWHGTAASRCPACGEGRGRAPARLLSELPSLPGSASPRRWLEAVYTNAASRPRNRPGRRKPRRSPAGEGGGGVSSPSDRTAAPPARPAAFPRPNGQSGRAPHRPLG